MYPLDSLELCCFVFTDTAHTEIYPLSLHDALPIYADPPSRDWLDGRSHLGGIASGISLSAGKRPGQSDRKSTRLNSSHLGISYAVFCLKQKKLPAKTATIPTPR